MFKKTFSNEGTFEALYAAQKWLTENGYSYGSLCGCQPVGIMRGDFRIAKWKNLTAKERSNLDGYMTTGFREGPVEIFIKNHENKNTEC